MTAETMKSDSEVRTMNLLSPPWFGRGLMGRNISTRVRFSNARVRRINHSATEVCQTFYIGGIYAQLDHNRENRTAGSGRLDPADNGFGFCTTD